MKPHAKCSPSASSRWLSCTASPGYLAANADKLPADTGSVYADEGTKAHAIGAYALVDDLICEDGVMAAHIKGYVDLVKSNVTGDGQLKVETQVPLFYSPSEVGTVDAYVLNDDGLFITDLKYGQGVSVEARDNTQLAIYAESLIQHLALRETLPDQFSVVLRIYQPRAREGEPLREWFTSLGELKALGERIGAVAKAIYENDPEALTFAPSDKACRWCPAKGFCEARAGAVTEAISLDFTDSPADVVEKSPTLGTALPDDQLTRIVKAALSGDLRKWLDDVVEHVQQRKLADPASFPELKVVATEKRRTWGNEDEAAKLLKAKLGKEIWETSLISPSKAEKLLKGKDLSTRFTNRFQSLVVKAQGGPTLTLSDDPRPNYQTIQATDLL